MQTPIQYHEYTSKLLHVCVMGVGITTLTVIAHHTRPMRIQHRRCKLRRHLLLSARSPCQRRCPACVIPGVPSLLRLLENSHAQPAAGHQYDLDLASHGVLDTPTFFPTTHILRQFRRHKHTGTPLFILWAYRSLYLEIFKEMDLSIMSYSLHVIPNRVPWGSPRPMTSQ